MEQNNNNRPKMPKFNMSWIYIMVLIALVAFYFSGGDSIGGGMNKKATYTEFKAYVDSGYAQKVEVNKGDNQLKMYVKGEYIRKIFKSGTDKVGKNPYLEVEYGSVDKVEEWGKKRLAYAIDYKTEGYYVLVNFQGEAELPKELERNLQISDSVIRYQVIKQIERKVGIKPRAVRPAPVAAPVAAPAVEAEPAAEAPVETPAAE